MRDYILESAMMLAEGLVPIQLMKNDKGYYFNVFNTLYGYYSSEEAEQKLQDLGATFKKEQNFKQMRAIASKNGNVWIRVDSSKLSRTKDSNGALAGKKISEGAFIAYENYHEFFEGVYDAVTCESNNCFVTVAEICEGGSLVSISDNNGNIVEMVYDDHESAIIKALDFVNASIYVQENLFNEKVTGRQMRALFAKGFVKKTGKGKLKYSKNAFKKGRPKGKGDSKPRAKAGTSPNYERNKAYREKRKKIKQQNEGFSDLVQLKGNEYEANNQGSEDRYCRRIIGVKGVKPIANRRTESTEASAIKGKVAGSTRPIAKKRKF